MTSRSEQLSAQFTSQFTAPLSAMGKSQFEAQLGMLQAWSSRAMESAEQLISLNLRASRTSVEQATGTFKQLLDATNPRDVIAVGSRAQGQWHYLFEYGRELLSIASGAQVQSWTSQPWSPMMPALQLTVTQTRTPAPDAASANTDTASAAPAVAAREVAAAAVETAETAADIVDNGSAAAYEAAAEPQAAEVQAAEVQTAAEPAAAAQADQADQAVQKMEAAVEAAIADNVPPAKETPLVQALNEAAPKPASAEHPVAATIALAAHNHVELPVVTPVDAKPPVHTPPAKEQRRSPRARK